MFTWPVIIRDVWRQCHFLAHFQPVTLKIDKDITNPVGKESDLIHCGTNEGIIRKPLSLHTEQKASIIKSSYSDLENLKTLNIKSLWIIFISKMPAVCCFSGTTFKPNDLERHANDLKYGTIFIFEGYTPINLYNEYGTETKWNFPEVVFFLSFFFINGSFRIKTSQLLFFFTNMSSVSAGQDFTWRMMGEHVLTLTNAPRPYPAVRTAPTLTVPLSACV